MKLVILAGGLGTRISEESDVRPKPMIEIGGMPIIWHIMKLYSYYGINEFIICLGYKGHVIKEYFSNYLLHTSDITIDIKKNKISKLSHPSEPWKITLVDTGLNTMTGGRLKRVAKYIKKNEVFCLTYGDGLANVDIKKLIQFHKKNKKMATVTAVPTPGRFGVLQVSDNEVTHFSEKPKSDGTLINGGFFILNERILSFINNDKDIFEKDTLPAVAKRGELVAYKHLGFWQPMDTLREKNLLNELWASQKAPWNIWTN